MKNFIYIIPCRAGSKRIINKNFKNFLNTNLTEISLNTIIDSEVNKKDIFISSDSKIAESIAQKYNVNFHYRKSNFASDKASTYSLIKDFFQSFKDISDYKYLCLIQPTCPLRNSEDIVEARKIILKENKNSLISISQCTFSHPEYLYKTKDKACIKYIDNYNQKRSQEMNPVYFRNGAIYISSLEYLKKSNFIIDHNSLSYHIMPFIRSINIDNQEDWEIAELIYKNL